MSGSSDVRDILQLKKDVETHTSQPSIQSLKSSLESPRKKPGSDLEKRTIPRELYSLLDRGKLLEEDYSIVPSKAGFRAKPQLGAPKAQSW
jgi:hypothetical protein